MKKLYMTCLMGMCATGGVVANEYNVCGPIVGGKSIAYTAVVSQENTMMGSWAVGDGCVGETENLDVATMCDAVSVGGQAFCASAAWGTGTKDLDESTQAYGTYCHCRRTKMTSGGVLVDSEGQWVCLGADSTCYTSCAKYCAQTVSENVNGLREPIVVLPAF